MKHDARACTGPPDSPTTEERQRMEKTLLCGMNMAPQSPYCTGTTAGGCGFPTSGSRAHHCHQQLSTPSVCGMNTQLLQVLSPHTARGLQHGAAAPRPSGARASAEPPGTAPWGSPCNTSPSGRASRAAPSGRASPAEPMGQPWPRNSAPLAAPRGMPSLAAPGGKAPPSGPSPASAPSGPGSIPARSTSWRWASLPSPRWPPTGYKRHRKCRHPWILHSRWWAPETGGAQPHHGRSGMHPHFRTPPP
mmetsp:Transcript_26166/g.57837  ORF Transcript_26166/g.57837 Transcript_26166/m.57837 type:complete len:248 (+) Transcript_26166:184-927(+)